MNNSCAHCVVLALCVTPAALTFGCSDQRQSPLVVPATATGKPLTNPPEITSETEEGFADLVFFLEERKDLGGGEQLVTVSGIYKGHDVGLGVGISGGWTARSDGDPLPIQVRSGKITLRRTGEESDALLQAMASLYAVNKAPTRMRDAVEFTGLSLAGDPGHLDNGPAKVKLFYETGKDDEYGELFINIDLRGRRVELREKDPEYRGAIIKALAERKLGSKAGL